MTALDTAAASPPVASKGELFRLFLHEKDDPVPFYTKLAARSVAEFPFPVAGRRVLDLGSGPGWYSQALRGEGADVIPVDLGRDDVAQARDNGLPALAADAMRLPFPDAAFDGVFCSNMLEHVPSTTAIFDEIERVLRPGGWAWVSWTNWYSPWGGHDITPLWPTYVGRVLADVRRRPTLRVLDAVPRYYPSQRWVLRVPGVREVATWNCLLLLQRTDAPGQGGPR